MDGTQTVFCDGLKMRIRPIALVSVEEGGKVADLVDIDTVYVLVLRRRNTL